MKFKIFTIFAALAMVICFSFGASAQYMTQDVIFLKAGYIPVYNTSFNEKELSGSYFCNALRKLLPADLLIISPIKFIKTGKFIFLSSKNALITWG